MSRHDQRLIKPAVTAPPRAFNWQHYRSGDQRWYAVQSRDPQANTAFYYGAITTLIYCRPTCPGRVARRSNIVFFDTTSIAAQHGYRPCKRCNPDLDVWDRNTRGRELVRDAQTVIQELSAKRENWTVDEVAKQLGIGAAHLHRLFKKHLGRTPKSSGRPRDIFLSGDERQHQQHAMSAPSTNYETDCSLDSSNGATPADTFEQTWDFLPSGQIDLDFDFSTDPYLPESSPIKSFDMCTIIPPGDQVDLPSVDEHWTDWLSI